MPTRFPPDIYSLVELAALSRQGLGVLVSSGYCEVVSQTSFTDIWGPGGTRTWLQAAEQLRVISTSADDAAGGTGAQAVLILGLDINGVQIEETVATAGLSLSVLTTQSFFRTNDPIAIDMGVYGGSNVGKITIETATGVPQATIEAGESRSSHCHRTVPHDKQGMIYPLIAGVESNKTAQVRVKIRTGAGTITPPCTPQQTVYRIPGLLGTDTVALGVPVLIPPFTDIWLDAMGDTPNTTIGTAFVIVLSPA